MSVVEFKLKSEDLQKVTEAITEYAGNAEAVINTYLKGKAAQMAVDSIVVRIPESGRTWPGKQKSARSGNPFKTDFVNLGFIIKSKKTYNYLYFPDQAEGTSRGNAPIEFMEQGLDSVYDMIVNEILELLGRGI